jgi:hypothetical protein
VFITLQSVDGEDLKLTQATQVVLSLFSSIKEDLGMEVNITEVTRFDGCPEDVTTVASNSSNDLDLHLLWSEQPFGGLAEVQCPCDAAPLLVMAFRRCAGNFVGVVDWAEPDDSQCSFSDMTRQLCALPNMETLLTLTIQSEEFSSLDVYLAAVNVELAAHETLGNASASDSILATVDHLLSAPTEVLRRSQEEFNSSLLIVENLNVVVDNYPLPISPPLEIPHDTFTAVVDFNFDLETFTGSSVAFNSSNLHLIEGDSASSDFAASVTLSSDLAPFLANQQDLSIVFVIYKTQGLFMEREEFIIDNNRTTLQLGSTVVVEARLSVGATVSNIENVVTLTFSKNEVATENGSISICVFWNQTLDEGYGGWSEEGCRLVREDELTSVCTCNHLSRFALIVDTLPSMSEDRDIGPYIYVGGLFSCVLLLLTIVIYLFTRPQWSGVFLLNACVALLLLNLSVVASYHGRPSEKCCHSFSAILHSVFLASVLSLAALAVTKFGRAGGMKNKERTCGGKTFVIISGLAIIWIIPAVIVALSLGLSHTYSDVDSNALCRPVMEAFHYGLLLPWALIHLPLYLCLFLLPCPCFSNTLRENVRRSWLREYTGIVLSLLLFDIGWGLGLPAMHPLHLGNLRLCGQIVFSAANGCISLVLFVFFCALSENVRQTCTIPVTLKRNSIAMSDWQRQSGLYGPSQEEDNNNSKERTEATVTEECPQETTFEYDLDEVYGNPAAISTEEEYAFESQTQFN